MHRARVSVTALRRIVIARQGYASRARTGTRREVEETIRALSCVQLDSITAVERSHRIALGSRVGAYPRETVLAGSCERVGSSSTGRTRRASFRSRSGRSSARG
jgi:uncharacterized protein YcaQ